MVTSIKKVGIVGCGSISGIYFENARKFKMIEVTACADIDMEKAKESAAKHEVSPCTVSEIIADPEIDIILNLTIPQAHAEVGLMALGAGKSVYSEKPLGVTREEGRKLLDLAAEKGLRVGCAPDTFLGGGLQTCRKLIDDGWIGEPLGAAAFMTSPGPEKWHPSPEFFFKTGGGPMFDMGPYYLTALVSILGPVRRVTGSARISFPERVAEAEDVFGMRISVDVPTFVTGIMDFASGPVGTILMSFDVAGSQLPRIEIYGSEGTLSLPDPNTFGGPVKIFRSGAEGWSEIPLTHGYSQNARGLGLTDMACGLISGRPHRANGDMAFHVLDLMHAFHDASEGGKHIDMESSCERPAPLPMKLLPGMLDD